MLSIEEKTKIKIKLNNIKHYLKLGYSCNNGDILEVFSYEVPKNKKQKIIVKCSECGEEKIISAGQYLYKNKIVYCKKCIQKHREETVLKKYGCKNVFQLEEIQEKQKSTILEKYGVENVFQLDEIKEKSKETLISKYGADHPMRVKKIAEEVTKKSFETIYKNGSQSCSSEQKHIFEIIGGELNYLFESFWLDIFFKNDNIYLEYDGSGHDISVKYHKISEEDFKKKEIIRYKLLKSRGLKEIQIISRKDILPADDILLNMVNVSFDVLKNNLSDYIVFDIDKHFIKYKNFFMKYDFKKNIIFDKNNSIVTTIGENI